jgi:hypothetical protein
MSLMFGEPMRKERKGIMKYLYALMDAETRFWNAQQVADTKNTANVQPLFKEAKQIAGKRAKYFD